MHQRPKLMYLDGESDRALFDQSFAHGFLAGGDHSEGGLVCAAGSQAEYHGQNQQQGKQLLHS